MFPFQGCIKAFGWAWERDIEFDSKVVQVGTNRRCLRWVDWRGNPVPVSSEVTANSHFRSTVLKVSRGEALGDVGDLLFRDPEHFRAGELLEHVIAGKKLLWSALAQRVFLAASRSLRRPRADAARPPADFSRR